MSEETIRLLVDSFYAKVRRDPELAPIFLRAIPGDWQPHLDQDVRVLVVGDAHHRPLQGQSSDEAPRAARAQPELFERWLALFDETCRELFDDGIREEFRAKAERIAESLKLALFYRPDRPWPPEATQ